MNGLKPLSHGVRSISGKTFDKKFVALGRVLDLWDQIVGADMAEKAQPVKLRMQKRKGKHYRILVIGVPSALSTMLHYQKGIIKERIGRLLGDDFISDIEFVATEARHKDGAPQQMKAKPLEEKDKQDLSNMLETVEDMDLKSRLNSFGESVIQKDKQSKN